MKIFMTSTIYLHVIERVHDDSFSKICTIYSYVWTVYIIVDLCFYFNLIVCRMELKQIKIKEYILVI